MKLLTDWMELKGLFMINFIYKNKVLSIPYTKANSLKIKEEKDKLHLFFLMAISKNASVADMALALNFSENFICEQLNEMCKLGLLNPDYSLPVSSIKYLKAIKKLEELKDYDDSQYINLLDWSLVAKKDGSNSRSANCNLQDYSECLDDNGHIMWAKINVRKIPCYKENEYGSSSSFNDASGNIIASMIIYKYKFMGEDNKKYICHVDSVSGVIFDRLNYSDISESKTRRNLRIPPVFDKNLELTKRAEDYIRRSNNAIGYSEKLRCESKDIYINMRLNISDLNPERESI
ncbi:MAG: hypothetical protein Q4B64_09640 [Spirochaetales bacterium]|nr:hypothetical protein [Spirochaetales bacterium]